MKCRRVEGKREEAKGKRKLRNRDGIMDKFLLLEEMARKCDLSARLVSGSVRLFPSSISPSLPLPASKGGLSHG